MQQINKPLHLLPQRKLSTRERNEKMKQDSRNPEKKELNTGPKSRAKNYNKKDNRNALKERRQIPREKK